MIAPKHAPVPGCWKLIQQVMDMAETGELDPAAPESAPAAKKSGLAKSGCLVMVLAVALSSGLGGLVVVFSDGSGRATGIQRILALCTDLASVGVFVGLGMLIIGLVRNARNAKK
jgi:hypothetical protein